MGGSNFARESSGFERKKEGKGEMDDAGHLLLGYNLGLTGLSTRGKGIYVKEKQGGERAESPICSDITWAREER